MPAKPMPAISPAPTPSTKPTISSRRRPRMRTNAVRFRRGWFLGDGTGAGKGRQVAAIILDNWLRSAPGKPGPPPGSVDLQIRQTDRGRRARLDRDRRLSLRHRPAVALSPGCGDRARRRHPLHHLRDLRTQAQGRQAQPHSADHRLARPRFDGVVVFDEAHAMANAAGDKAAPTDPGRTRRKETVATGPGRAAPAKRIARCTHPLRLGDRRHDGAEPRLCRAARPLGHR